MKNYRAHIYLFIVNLFYGAGFSITKLVMPEYIKPFGFILLRVVIATTLFFIVHYLWLKEKVARKDLLLLAVCSVFGVVINQEMFFLGLSITTPINASLIMIMAPILVFAISFFLAQEKANWQKILGLILGLAGALIMLAGKRFNFSGETLPGDLCIFLNASSYAVYLVIVRPLMKKYHPLTVIKWVFFFGMFPVLLIGFSQFKQIQWSTFTPQIWMAVAFVIICITFLAYFLNVLALREVHSSVVGAYMYMQPILATLISILMGNDKITIQKIVSAVFIFSGVYFVSFARQIKMFNKPKEEPDTDDMIFE